MSRSWQDNAAEFAALTKQGVDLRLAVLVACSVEKRNSAHRPATNVAGAKVSTRKFAEEAGTGNPRIARHLDAWNACAAKGWCGSSANLTPDMAANPDLRTPTPEQFAAVFRELSTRKAAAPPVAPTPVAPTPTPANETADESAILARLDAELDPPAYNLDEVGQSQEDRDWEEAFSRLTKAIDFLGSVCRSYPLTPDRHDMLDRLIAEIKAQIPEVEE